MKYLLCVDVLNQVPSEELFNVLKTHGYADSVGRKKPDVYFFPFYSRKALAACEPGRAQSIEFWKHFSPGAIPEIALGLEESQPEPESVAKGSDSSAAEEPKEQPTSDAGEGGDLPSTDVTTAETEEPTHESVEEPKLQDREIQTEAKESQEMSGAASEASSEKQATNRATVKAEITDKLLEIPNISDMVNVSEWARIEEDENLRRYVCSIIEWMTAAGGEDPNYRLICITTADQLQIFGQIISKYQETLEGKVTEAYLEDTAVSKDEVGSESESQEYARPPLMFPQIIFHPIAAITLLRWVAGQRTHQEYWHKELPIANPKRIHRLFPTGDEILCGHRNEFTSDHLPFYCDTKLVKIISMNVLGGEVPYNGFHFTPGDYGKYSEPPKRGPGCETASQADRRYRRIARRLANAAALLDVEVILLQEVGLASDGDDPSSKMAEYLQQTLAPTGSWKVIPTKIGLISCYKEGRLALGLHTFEEHAGDRIHNLAFQVTDDHGRVKQVLIHNVWGRFDEIPAGTKHYYEKLLLNPLGGLKWDQVAVVGDTNSRISPKDHELHRNITGIIPPKIGYDLFGKPVNLQEGDHPDGAFCRNKGDVIQQPAILSIDLTTETPRLFIEDDTAWEKSEVDECPVVREAHAQFKMVLGLDVSFKTQTLGQTMRVVDLETKLRDVTRDPDILVCKAVDRNNRQAIAICMPASDPHLKKRTIHPLREWLNAEFGDAYAKLITSERSGKQFYVIYVPKTEVPRLLVCLKLFILNKFVKGIVDAMSVHDTRKARLMPVISRMRVGLLGSRDRLIDPSLPPDEIGNGLREVLTQVGERLNHHQVGGAEFFKSKADTDSFKAFHYSFGHWPEFPTEKIPAVPLAAPR